MCLALLEIKDRFCRDTAHMVKGWDSEFWLFPEEIRNKFSLAVSCYKH